jgi:hypothetical protein
MVLLQSVGHSHAPFAGIMIALANTDRTKSTVFVAYVQVVRLGSAEIGVALMTTWHRVREQFHSNLLGQHVASGDSNVTDSLSKLAGFFDSPDSWLGSGAQSGVARRACPARGKYAGIHRRKPDTGIRRSVSPKPNILVRALRRCPWFGERPLCADSVAKVFSGRRTTFFRTADAFRTWRRGEIFSVDRFSTFATVSAICGHSHIRSYGRLRSAIPATADIDCRND